MDEDPSVDPRFDPVFQRGYDPEKHGEPARVTARREYIGPPPSSPVEPDPVSPAMDDNEWEPEPRNPWLIALVVVSVLLVGLALFVIVGPGSASYYSSQGQPDLLELLVQSLSYFAPMALMTAGLMGLVSRLVIHILWTRR